MRRASISSYGWRGTSTKLGVDSVSNHPKSPLTGTTSGSCRALQSHLSSGGCACMEHSSIKRDVIVEFGYFQVSLENGVHAMLQRCWPTSIYLTHFIEYVTCPWSLIHIRFYIYYYYCNYYYYISKQKRNRRSIDWLLYGTSAQTGY